VAARTMRGWPLGATAGDTPLIDLDASVRSCGVGRPTVSWASGVGVSIPPPATEADQGVGLEKGPANRPTESGGHRKVAPVVGGAAGMCSSMFVGCESS
jgi:hypothetical protein